MIAGLIADTHSIDDNTIRHIVKEFLKRGVKMILHCGDIEPQHVNPELFGGIPVVCAINKEQLRKINVKKPPLGWKFTVHSKKTHKTRIIDINHVRCYVGHRFSNRILVHSQTDFVRAIEKLRAKFDGLRWVFAGHTHHQILVQTQLASFVNPGAVSLTMDGYEFATVNLDTNELVFCRIPQTKPVEKPFSVGVISDSLDISKLDTTFWKKLAQEMSDRQVSCIIHCGNIALDDIGRPELKKFKVYYWLRPNQFTARKCPPNWHQISRRKPVVKINGRQFYLHANIARILLKESENDMHKECLKVLEANPEVSFILYGGTNDAFLSEGQRARILNPGDVKSSKNFAVIKQPVTEITFGHVPFDPLPIIQ